MNERTRTIRVPPQGLQRASEDDMPIHITPQLGQYVRPVPRTRLVRWIEGAEDQLEVTDCGNGRYRVEGQAGTVHFLFEGFSFGSTLVCDEWPDGTLEVTGFELDPRLDRILCWIMPRDFVHTPAWHSCGDKIMAAGGNWEFLFGGLFSVYVPVGRAPFERLGDLQREINASLRESPA